MSMKTEERKPTGTTGTTVTSAAAPAMPSGHCMHPDRRAFAHGLARSILRSLDAALAVVVLTSMLRFLRLLAEVNEETGDEPQYVLWRAVEKIEARDENGYAAFEALCTALLFNVDRVIGAVADGINDELIADARRFVVRELRRARERAPAHAADPRAQALKRLPRLFAEIAEYLSWDEPPSDPEHPRARLPQLLLEAQSSWAHADNLFELGRALLALPGAHCDRDIFYVVDAIDTVAPYTIKHMAQAAAYGRECVLLALALAKPMPNTSPTLVDMYDAPLRRSTKGAAQ